MSNKKVSKQIEPTKTKRKVKPWEYPKEWDSLGISELSRLVEEKQKELSAFKETPLPDSFSFGEITVLDLPIIKLVAERVSISHKKNLSILKALIRKKL